MQYTIRNVSPSLDEAVRRRAKQEGKSLNEILVVALAQALGVASTAVKQRDLRGIAGTWVEDAQFDAAITDQHRIDEGMWR